MYGYDDNACSPKLVIPTDTTLSVMLFWLTFGCFDWLWLPRQFCTPCLHCEIQWRSYVLLPTLDYKQQTTLVKVMGKWNCPILQRKVWKWWSHNGSKLTAAKWFTGKVINTPSDFVLQLIGCFKHREVTLIADKPRDSGHETFSLSILTCVMQQFLIPLLPHSWIITTQLLK